MTHPHEERAERISPGLARVVLGVAYLGLAALYAWQASNRVSPTIFSDEIEFTQISRGIADGGVPSRRGEPSGFETLYTYLVAPAWWLDDPEAAWEAAKLIGVLVMTTALLPAYALARHVVSRAWALAAAVIAVAAPPLAYAPYLLDEPLAYPTATAALWALTGAVARPTPRRLVLAAVLCAFAPLVRGQLAVLLLVLAVALVAVAWRTDRFRRSRSTWSAGDWTGIATLLVGAAVAASAALGHRSEPWYVATGFFKERMLDHGVWALAALTVGLGVLPVLATVVALLSRRLRADDDGRAFVVVAAATVVVLVGYAAVKGAYLSTVFSILVLERNLIYLVPIAAAATAAVLSRQLASMGPLLAGLAAALLLIANGAFRLDQYPYFEAPGLAMPALANRELIWDEPAVRRALYVVALVSFVVLAATWIARSRVALGLAAAATCAVLAWTLTTEVYAARGLNTFSERLHGATPQPPDWVDRLTDGEPAIFLGQQIDDANPVYLLEFWNPSIEHVWSLDGSAPLPTLSPDLGSPDGTIVPNPGVDWVVTGNGVAVVGEPVGEPRAGMSLVRVAPPLRFRHAVRGVSSDGWMGEHSTYAQYAPDEGHTRGFARVTLSREGACSTAIPTADVVVRVGTVVVQDKQPALGAVTDVGRDTLAPCAATTVAVRATVPFFVDVTVSSTFVPAEIDASSGDRRELGARVSFGFLPL